MYAILAFLGGLFLTAGIPVPESQYYVEVPYQGIDDLKALVDKGYDVGGVDLERHVVSLVMKEGALRQVSDLRVVSKRLIRTPDTGFKQPKEVEKFLRDTEDKYPHLARLESIGHTLDGQDVYAIELTAKFVVPSQPKKTVLFDAMHHAREVMTTEVALDIIDYLTSRYETDEKVQKWLNQYRVFVVPMLNPDGNNRVWNQNSMWRKNGHGGYGVDVNRNYPYAWNTCNGSSSNKNADDYRGEAPNSEMETQAITAFATKIKPMIAISYHSYSEIVIYPFGCSPKKVTAPDASTYLQVGRDLAKKLVRDSGNGTYTPGTSYELLYNVDGGSVDWMYSQLKTMAFVIEMNSSSQGFQPSYAAWRDKTVEKQRAGWQYVLDRMSGPGLSKKRVF